MVLVRKMNVLIVGMTGLKGLCQGSAVHFVQFYQLPSSLRVCQTYII